MSHLNRSRHETHHSAVHPGGNCCAGDAIDAMDEREGVSAKESLRELSESCWALLGDPKVDGRTVLPRCVTTRHAALSISSVPRQFKRTHRASKVRFNESLHSRNENH